MPEMNGINFLKKLRQFNEGICVVMITAYSEVSTAVEAMKIEAQNAIDNKNLKLIAMGAEIHKPFTFHASRHTALTEVAAKTGNVFSVMKFGGIRKVDTAMIYVHLASEKF